MRICVRSHRADTCFRRLAAFRERLRSSGVLRIAPGGTRQGLMLRRSALRSDSTAVRAPGSCRITRYALRATLGQMRQFSSRSALARADPGAVLLVAAKIAPAGYRPTRGRRIGCSPTKTTSGAAKTVRGRTRCASEAPRSAAPLAARAARFNNILGASVRAQRAARSELCARPGAPASQGSRRSRPPQRSFAACPAPASPQRTIRTHCGR